MPLFLFKSIDFSDVMMGAWGQIMGTGAWRLVHGDRNVGKGGCQMECVFRNIHKKGWIVIFVDQISKIQDL